MNDPDFNKIKFHVMNIAEFHNFVLHKEGEGDGDGLIKVHLGLQTDGADDLLVLQHHLRPGLDKALVSVSE